KTPFFENEPMFSPDGRWIAYTSNESGHAEVYVRPYPGPGGKWQISSAGGMFPAWSASKHELLFESLDQHVMAAPYHIEGDSFVREKPEPWTEIRFFPLRTRSFAIHPDGERIAVAVPQDASTAKQDRVVFVLNFFDELRRIAPVK